MNSHLRTMEEMMGIPTPEQTTALAARELANYLNSGALAPDDLDGLHTLLERVTTGCQQVIVAANAEREKTPALSFDEQESGSESVLQKFNPTGPGQQDEFTELMRGTDYNFIGAKRLPDGTYAGIRPVMHSYAICIGVAPDQPAQKQFCYNDLSSCAIAFGKLSALSDEPEGWVTSRGEG